MLLTHSAAMREADRRMMQDHDYPGSLLMEQAGRRAATEILQDFPGASAYWILVGPGNNGGDGWVIARYLHLAGKTVRCLTSISPAEPPGTGDAALHLRILKHLPVPIDTYQGGEIQSAAGSGVLLIDALLGTGINALLRGPVAAMIDEARGACLPCVAIDLPSGLNADTGQMIQEVIPAQVTYTFQLPKICHAVSPASLRCGKVVVLDIGIWPQVIASLQLQRTWLSKTWVDLHWQHRALLTHKGSFGHVLVLAGSRSMSGAAILAAKAALIGGAGLVTVAGPGSLRIPLLGACPEVMCLPLGDEEREHLMPADVAECLQAASGKKALLLGPGIGRSPETLQWVRDFLVELVQSDARDIPLLMDADGLSAIASLGMSPPPGAVLTPHPGEMKRLCGEEDVQDRRLEIAESYAQSNGVTLVLKGAGTLVATPEGKTFVNSTGNPSLATGGTGDVLAGLIAALLAQGYDKGIAAAIGAYLHGAAADRWVKKYASESFHASALLSELKHVFPRES